MTLHLPTTIYSQDINEKDKEDNISQRISNLLIRRWEEYKDHKVTADILILDLDSDDWSRYISDSDIHQSFELLCEDMDPFVNDGGVVVALYDDEVDISGESSFDQIKNMEWLRGIQPVRIGDVEQPILHDEPAPTLDIETTIPVVREYLRKGDKQPEQYLRIDRCDFSNRNEVILATVDDDPAAIAFNEQKVEETLYDLPGHIVFLPRPQSLRVNRTQLVESLIEIGEYYSNKEISYYTGDDSSINSMEDLGEEDQDRIERAKHQAERKGCNHDSKEVVVVQKHFVFSGLGAGSGKIKIVCTECGEYYQAEEIGADENSSLLKSLN